MSGKICLFIWYVKNLYRFFIALGRLFLHGIFHPIKSFSLLFSIYSKLNYSYSDIYTKLLNFNDTKVFEKLKYKMIFAHCNYFNCDLRVMHPMEVVILSILVKYFKPNKIFEFGTYNGFTTFHFAQNTDENCLIYTLDLPRNFHLENKKRIRKYSYDDYLVANLSQEYINNRIFHKTGFDYKISEIFGDSRIFDFSPYTKKIDFVFIDGNHSCEYVASDTKNALNMLSENGIIIWHDYDYIIHNDLFRYLNDLARELQIYHIPKTRFAIYGKSIT